MKIYITGPGGSGKSTLASKLGDKYDTPVVHLDKLLWKEPGIENENYGQLQEEEIRKESWIIEGPSCSIVKSMKNSVDLIILLNQSPIKSVISVITRYLKCKFLKDDRIGINDGMKNNISFDFLSRTFIYRTRQLPRLHKNITESGLDPKLIELSSYKGSFELTVKYIEKNL